MKSNKVSADWDVKLNICCPFCHEWQSVNFYDFNIKPKSHHTKVDFRIKCRSCGTNLSITHINP